MFGQIQRELNSNVTFQVKFNYSDNVNTTVDTITVDGDKASYEHENFTEPSDSTAQAETPANLKLSKVEQSVEILSRKKSLHGYWLSKAPLVFYD